MILRLSQKLCTKIKAGALPTMPLDENPFADWSAHLFIVNRTQYRRVRQKSGRVVNGWFVAEFLGFMGKLADWAFGIGSRR